MIGRAVGGRRGRNDRDPGDAQGKAEQPGKAKHATRRDRGKPHDEARGMRAQRVSHEPCGDQDRHGARHAGQQRERLVPPVRRIDVEGEYRERGIGHRQREQSVEASTKLRGDHDAGPAGERSGAKTQRA